MDIISKGVNMLRIRERASRQRASPEPQSPTAKDEERKLSSAASSIVKTPSISNSVTSDDGSLSGPGNGFSTLMTPSNGSIKGTEPLSIQDTEPLAPPSAAFRWADHLGLSPSQSSPLSPIPKASESSSYFTPKKPSVIGQPNPSDSPDPEPLTSPAAHSPPAPASAYRSTAATPTPPSPRVLQATKPAGTRTTTPSRLRPRQKHRKLRLDDFVLKQTIGTGAFGRVMLAQSKVNLKHYAIKILDKHDIVQRRQVEHANNEPAILRDVAHPFLVTLWDAFQDDHHLYMAMDYAAGGELFRILRREGHFSELTGRFYAAEVILALEYLHERDIVYRDLKPENILLDARGHVKLTDFGFAKRVPDLTWTICGTPDYLAPEVIRSQGYTKAIDWWSLGVLIFEMLVGRPPFVDNNPVDLYEKILDCRIDWPSQVSPVAKDLLMRLLTPDLSQRYGNLSNGVDDIKKHPWFDGLDFNQVLQRKVQPPYIPDVKTDGDAHCFARYEEVHPHHSDHPQASHDTYHSKFPAF